MPGPEGQLGAPDTSGVQAQEGAHRSPGVPGGVMTGAAAVAVGHRSAWTCRCARAMSAGLRGWGSAGKALWLTVLTPWMPVADCPPGDRSGREASFMPRPASPWAVPSRAEPRGLCRPVAAEAPSAPGARIQSWAAGSRQAAQRCQPCLRLRGGRGPGRTTRVRQTPTGAGSGRHQLRLGPWPSSSWSLGLP